MHVTAAALELEPNKLSGDRAVTLLRARPEQYNPGNPSKKFQLDADGKTWSPDVAPGFWYDTRQVAFESLDELYEILSAVENEILIFGEPDLSQANSDGWLRRKDWLFDVPRSWLVMDLDKLHRFTRSPVDPVRDRTAIRSWIREVLLPPSLRDVQMILHWSASTGTPDEKGQRKIGCHLIVLLDRPIAATERQELLRSINRYACSRVDAERNTSIVDWRVGISNQPIFIADPSFEGVEDPFAGSGSDRWHLVDGEAAVVDLDRLKSEVADCSNPGKTTRGRKRANKARGSKVAVPTSITEERVARSLSAGEKNLAVKRNGLYADFAHRALDDIRKVLTHSYGGRIEEGQRSIILHIVASLLAHTVGEASPFRWRQAVYEYGQMFIGRDWLDDARDGWKEKTTWERLLLDLCPDQHPRFEEPDFTNRGQPGWEDRPHRYCYSKNRIIQDLGITEDEMEDLDLQVLITERIRSRRRRDAADVRTREEYREDVCRGSVREFTSELGISEATYYRWRKSGKIQERRDHWLVTIDGNERRYDRAILDDDGSGAGAGARARVGTEARHGKFSFPEVAHGAWAMPWSPVKANDLPADRLEIERWRLPQWVWSSGLVREVFVDARGVEHFWDSDEPLGLIDRVGFWLLAPEETQRIKTLWDDSGRVPDTFRKRLLQPQQLVESEFEPETTCGPHLVVDNTATPEMEEIEIDFGEPVRRETPMPSQACRAAAGPVSDENWRAVEDIPF